MTRKSSRVPSRRDGTGDVPDEPGKVRRDTGSRRGLLSGAALAAAGIFASANSLDGAFLLDDLPNILIPPLMMQDLSFSSFSALIRSSVNRTRPVANLSFGLNHYFGGDSTLGFHLVNGAIHLVNGILAFLLFRGLLRCALPADRADRVSLLGSLIWVVHPVNPQAVTYIVQRMTLLAALFLFLAFLSFLRASDGKWERRPGWWGAVLACYLLSVLSKEMTVVLPGLLFLHAMYFGAGRQEAVARIGLPLLGMVAAAVMVLFALGTAWDGKMLNSLTDYSMREFTTRERLLTQSRVVFQYLGLILVPTSSRLMLDHHVVKSTGVFSPATTLPALLGIGVLVALAILLYRRHRFASFCVVWYLMLLSVESTFLPLELMFEHRMYLPMIGVIFFVLYWADLLLSRAAWGGTALFAGSIAVVVAFGWMTWERNGLYRNPVAFWEDNARKAPGKARVQNNLGVEYSERGDAVRAMRQYQRALELDPGFAEAAVNVAAGYLERRDYRGAIALLAGFQGRARLPADYFYTMGLSQFGIGDYGAAAGYFRKSLDIDPYLKDANVFLGRISGAAGEYDTAWRFIRREYELHGDGSMYYYEVGSLYERRNMPEDAAMSYRQAIQSPGTDRYKILASQKLAGLAR